MPKVLSQYDLSKIPVKGLVPESGTSAPTSPAPGQMWYDTNTNLFKVYENGAWVFLSKDTTYPQGLAGDITVASPDNTVLSSWTALALRNAIDALQKVTSVAGRAGAVTLTKSDVGLANVDNTSDANKPVSSATQTALNAKAPLADPVFTGDPQAPTRSQGDNDTSIATTAFVVAATAPKANLASPAFTGTPTVPTPTTGTGIANKDYVDGAIQGLDAKNSVRVATTANITLSGTQTIDAVAVAAGDRVLVKDQSTASQNGLYIVASGAWSRAADMDTWAEVPGSFVFVEDGSNNVDTGWISTANAGGTLGTTAITWTQFSASGTVTASTGLTKVGNDIRVASLGITTTMLADSAVTSAKLADGSVDLLGSKVANNLPISRGGTGSSDAYAARLQLNATSATSALNPALTAGTWATMSFPQGMFFPDKANQLMVNVVDASTLETVLIDTKMDTTNGTIAIRSDVAVAAGALRVSICGIVL